MSENKDSLGEDLRAYFAALREHWMWWVAGSFPAALVAVYQGGGGVIPAWCLWTWAILGILVAAFLAWRDEHRKVKCKSLRAILNKVAHGISHVNLYQNESGGVTSIEETTWPLISVSEEFGSEEEVEWVCEKLFELGHDDPFTLFEAMYGVGAFKGKKLKFLQDAFASGGRFVRNEIDAFGFIRTFWADRNGLREINWPIHPVKIVDGRIVWQDSLPRPLSSAKEARLYLYPPTIEVDGKDLPISTPFVLPRRQLQQEPEPLSEDDFATLVVPDRLGCIPGVKRQQ